MFCCGPSLATDASVGVTPKCCKRFLKLFSSCRGIIADDGRDSHDNGRDIHLKCVLACCGGTVADNNIADRANREECCVEQEQKRKRKTKSKNKNKKKLEKTVQKKRFMVLNKKSNDLETTAEETESDKVCEELLQF